MQQNDFSDGQLDQLYNKALELHHRGDYENAIFYYQKITAIDPYLSEIYFNTGIAQVSVGRFDDAIESFNSAIYINPTEANPYYDLGNIYFKQGKIKQAILCYSKAVQIKPDYTDAHNNLDVLLDNINNTQVLTATYRILFEQNYYDIVSVGPQRIRLETSSACNLRCQLCPTGIDYKSTDRTIMRMKTFDKIVEQIKKFQILHDAVLYLGGEPLMNNNFPLMCKRIKEETDITQTMFNTNSMLLDEKMCRELANANIDQISISIDGRSPKENDLVRKGSEYSTVLANSKMLKGIAPNIHITIANTIIKRQGDPEQPVTPDFLLRDFPEFNIATTYAMQWPGLNIEKSSLKNLTLIQGPKNNFCKMPFTEMSVRPNGDVTMCCYDILGHHVMGNIHDADLLSIWTGAGYKNLRANMLAQNNKSLPKVCKRCVNYTGYVPVDQN